MFLFVDPVLNVAVTLAAAPSCLPAAPKYPEAYATEGKSSAPAPSSAAVAIEVVPICVNAWTPVGVPAAPVNIIGNADEAETVYVTAAGFVIAGLVVLVIEAVPAALGVYVVVTAPEPLAVIVAGANVPATVEAGVMTSPAGHAPPVGVNVTTTAAPATPDMAGKVMV